MIHTPVTRAPSTLRSIAGALLAAAMLVGAAAACTGPDQSPEAFCEKLRAVTGPGGAEDALRPGDPARLNQIVVELNELLERAPDDIAPTAETLVTFFERYQRSPRGSRRDVLAANEQQLLTASQELDDYALRQCGVFLERVPPTPIPTVNPGIDIQPE